MARQPLRRRQPAADTLAALDMDRRRDLTHGRTFFPESAFATIEDMQATWEIVRDELLAEWIEADPGSRPLAWWLFDNNRQERPIVRPWAEPEWLARERADSRFGFLHTEAWCGAPGVETGYLQQSEFDYLLEHGLLLPGEEQRYRDRHGDGDYQNVTEMRAHYDRLRSPKTGGQR